MNVLKGVRISLPIFLIVVSVIFFSASIMMPRADIGDPNAVIYFPLLCSIGLFICGLLYLFRELREEADEKVGEDLTHLLKSKTLATIAWIVTLCIGYTIVFEHIGFIISTILLLGGIFFFLNGWRKWKVNLVITILFTSLCYVAFKLLLDVNLP